VPLAGHGLRPTPLRRRAGRPQLKRDPLGGGATKSQRAPIVPCNPPRDVAHPHRHHSDHQHRQTGSDRGWGPRGLEPHGDGANNRQPQCHVHDQVVGANTLLDNLDTKAGRFRWTPEALRYRVPGSTQGVRQRVLRGLPVHVTSRLCVLAPRVCALPHPPHSRRDIAPADTT